MTQPRRPPRRGHAGCAAPAIRISTSAALVLTLLTRHLRGDLVLPALLGDGHDVQAGRRGRPALHRAAGRSTFTLDGYVYVLTHTRLGAWYLNSMITAVGDHRAGRLHGRLLRLRHLAASLSRPHAAVVDDPRELHGADPALIVNHFIIMAGVKLLNTYLGIILPQLIAPVIVIVYKQFFDSVPRDFREAAVMDGANEFQLLFRIFLPMNWGVTTALAIITFIGAWNAFLWPFLAVQDRRHDDGHRRHHRGAGRLRRLLRARARRRRAGRPAGRASSTSSSSAG